MNLTLHEPIGKINLGKEPFMLKIEGYRQLDNETIIFLYKEWQKENYCQLRYKWDEAAQWFSVEIISFATN